MEMRLQGVLAEWNPAKACGWVESSDGQRLFTHKSEFMEQFNDYAPPMPGTPLTFIVGVDAKSGKERAQQIQLMGVAGGPMGEARLSGRLADWNPAKACGWVEASGGQRLFAHKSEFTFQFPDGAGPSPGMPVTFVVGVDAKSGKERAQQIAVAGAHTPQLSYAPIPVMPFAGRAMMPYTGKGAGKMPMNVFHMSGPARIYGVLNEWNVTKGCGWLGTPQNPGVNYFAHKSEFVNQFADDKPPPPGTPVSFAVGIDAKSGKERAQEIRFEASPPSFHMSGRQPRAAPQMAPVRAWSPGGQNGTLAEWLPEKACGWIESSTGQRFFTHKSEFVEPFEDGGEPPVGSEVSFVIGTDPKSGKQRACQIQLGHGLSPPSNELEGTILEWNPSKACGWVRPDNDENQKYFTHKSEFVEPFEDGEEPPVGTRVIFVLGRDVKSGRERAQEIRLADQGEEVSSKRPKALVGGGSKKKRVA